MRGLKFIVILIVLFIFRSWFGLQQTLSSGDWPYLFAETIQGFSFIPDPQFLWLGPYYQITFKLFVQYLNIPFEIAERFWWFGMFLLISSCSSLYLAKVVLKNSTSYVISVLIFLTNTYILMIVGGGQMGVALSYAFAPAVLASLIQSLHAYSYKKFFWAGLLLALQVMFDPRIAYVTFIGVGMYLILSFFSGKNKKHLIRSILSYIFISGLVTCFINSPWILARIVIGAENFLSDASSGSLEALRFFSFGSFSFALSLLHPNWPENIFGKTYFLRPEFLIIPIISFSSLLFIYRKREQKKEFLFFVFLALMGVFLSKGTQEPFGYVYEWLFNTIPGFFLFRDPTKFYVLIVISYSILIPYSLEKIGDTLYVFLERKNLLLRKDYLSSKTLYILFTFLWLFTIRQAVGGDLTGTFKPRGVPQEYILLKNFLVEDQAFSATIWVPTRTSFAFYSKTHPIVTTPTKFQNTRLSKFTTFDIEEMKKKFRVLNIKYIIIPYDTEGKIFVDDRKYNEKEYQKTVQKIGTVPFLKEVRRFGKIVVFQVQE